MEAVVIMGSILAGLAGRIGHFDMMVHRSYLPDATVAGAA
jgi:hypothetical protein